MDLSAAPVVVERSGITCSVMPVQNVLNRSTPRRVPMDLTINTYRGCEFGCRYCYARYTHQWLEHADPLAFERELYAKVDAPAALARQLARLDLAGREIAIGTATDPYQPLERQLAITRGILEALGTARGARIRLLTKSDLVTRDIDRLLMLAERHEVSVGITLVTLDRDLQRRLEPRAPTPDKRLGALAELVAAGVSAGVAYAPMMPGVNDCDEALDAVLGAAAAAGVRRGWGAVLWVPSHSREVFWAWLGEQFPGLLPRYRRWYREGIDLPEALRAELRGRLRQALARHGLEDRDEHPRARQLSLFDDVDQGSGRC